LPPFSSLFRIFRVPARGLLLSLWQGCGNDSARSVKFSLFLSTSIHSVSPCCVLSRLSHPAIFAAFLWFPALCSGNIFPFQPVFAPLEGPPCALLPVRVISHRFQVMVYCVQTADFPPVPHVSLSLRAGAILPPVQGFFDRPNFCRVPSPLLYHAAFVVFFLLVCPYVFPSPLVRLSMFSIRKDFLFFGVLLRRCMTTSLVLTRLGGSPQAKACFLFAPGPIFGCCWLFLSRGVFFFPDWTLFDRVRVHRLPHPLYIAPLCPCSFNCWLCVLFFVGTNLPLLYRHHFPSA